MAAVTPPPSQTLVSDDPQPSGSDPQTSEAAPPDLDGANEPVNTANPILIDNFTVGSALPLELKVCS